MEALALDGSELLRIEPGPERKAHYEAELRAARARWTQRHEEIDAIWVGRHLAYLGRYQDAIDWYGARLFDFPESVRLRRHRGHRYLSVRRTREAIEDLQKAWELCRDLPDAIEPDGAPNSLGIPRSTTQTNVLYHLALGHYLQADFERAAEVWGECVERSPNDDMLVAALNWQVHALRRSGQEKEARSLLVSILPEMDVIENHGYHRLLLLQKGDASLEETLAEEGGVAASAAVAYGAGVWLWCEGRRDEARALWEAIVKGPGWNAFGYLCAEAELASG